jgi:hypothetical protein
MSGTPLLFIVWNATTVSPDELKEVSSVGILCSPLVDECRFGTPQKGRTRATKPELCPRVAPRLVASAKSEN